MKRLFLLSVLLLIVGGIAFQPAPVRAQDNSTGCSNAPTQQFRYRAGWDTIVRVSDEDSRSNRLREHPNTDSDIVLMMPVGDQMLLLGSPRCGEGYRWWQVAIIKEGRTYTGWTVDGEGSVHYLQLVSSTRLNTTSATATTTPVASATPQATTTPYPTSVGDTCSLAPTYRPYYWGHDIQMRVTAVNDQPSNLRLLPSLDSRIVTTIPVGSTFTITGRFRCFQGYRWWPATYNGNDGWVGDGIRANGQDIYYIESVGNG